MDDAHVIDTLRNAAEALSLCTFLAQTETAEQALADLARECVDVATALAHRQPVAGGR